MNLFQHCIWCGGTGCQECGYGHPYKDMVIYGMVLLFVILMVVCFDSYGAEAYGCRWTVCNTKTLTCEKLRYGTQEEFNETIEANVKPNAVVYECGPSIPSRKERK